MPDDDSKQAKTNAEGEIPSPEDVGDAICRLKVQDDKEKNVTAKGGPYPDRPGEPDCMYYMRTRTCGYGINCRYNHPPYAAQATEFREDLPERVGQPDCGYYLKTGSCKYGSTCKYHHPKDRNGAGPVLFNALGLPMRQDEKPCPYYMKYGSCKFGAACKFHHPQPASLKTEQPFNGQSVLGSAGPSIMPSGMPYVGGASTWSLSRAPYMPDPRIQGSQAYLPVVVPSPLGMIATSGWNTYVGGLSPVPSSSILANGALYNSKNQGDPVYGAYPNLFSAANGILPERPDQPECRYFMNNGTCKYGSDCKYHHPRERMPQLMNNVVGPYGVPPRPGQLIYPNYSTYGVCYGTSLPFPPVFDPTLHTYSKMPQNGIPSEALPYPPSNISSRRVQRPDNTGGKRRNTDVTATSRAHTPESGGSPTPPHSSQSSSEPSREY